MRKRIPYGKQSIGIAEGVILLRTLYSPNLTQGPTVERFEDMLAQTLGARYAVAVSSGTAALQIANLAALRHQAEKSVTAIPSLTFAASASSVLLAGGRPEILDVSRETWNIGLEDLSEFADNLLTVDFAGLPSGISQKPELRTRIGTVIEDCAHSLGAQTPSGPVGNCAGSDMACFSFHPVKTITTGEGGAVLTNSEEMAESLRLFRSHGINRSNFPVGWEYDIASPGQNFRLTDLQASLGIAQLRKVRNFVEERNLIADRYRSLLDADDIELPPAAREGFVHAYHLFPILLENTIVRDSVYRSLKANGIDCQVHYKPLHQLSAFSTYAPNKLPIASDIGARILSLPIYPGLKKTQQRRVVMELKRALQMDSSRTK